MPSYDSSVNLDQLRTALALLEHGTVNRTAAAQALAPSSVSDRLRRLEEEVGVPLFDRDRDGMQVTAAGRSFLIQAAAALETLDRAVASAHDTAELTLGAQASIADELLPTILADLQRKHPGLRVRLRPDPDRTRLLTALARSDLDAVVLLDLGDCIGDLGFATPAVDFEHVDVREVTMAVVAGPGHPLVGSPATMEMVRRSGHLVGREPRCAFWMATHRWLGDDIELMAIGGLAQVREWVASGKGLAVLPDFTVRSDIATGRVARVDIEVPPLQLRLAWRRGRDASDALRSLLYAVTQL